MTIHHADPWLTIHGGDCRDVLATLPDASVHCVVTSPPYWSLRDYGTASWEGGDPACDHAKPVENRNTRPLGSFHGGSDAGNDSREKPYRDRCGKCGAVRVDRQLGLEATPEEYVADMVAVFREVRRVLRDDGTLWLNLGDSYAGGGGFSPDSPSNRAGSKQTTQHGAIRGTIKPQGSIKPKDLVGIPWRVAFALQADGWYLRSDIIWSKPNPMPESVTDRPTKAHEYLFLLTKAPRYFFDQEAVRRPISPYNEGRISVAPHGEHVAETGHRTQETRQYDVIKGANVRTVWTVATQPYPGAHFAVMPEALVEPCVLAGCPEGGTVLDPFGGSGTVARVANRLSRRAILIDLNPDYLAQQLERNRDMPLGLTA